VIKKPVNTCEGDFYQNMDRYVKPESAKKFWPEFFGLVQCNPDKPAFILMEDATAGYKKPAVLDVKLGVLR
jgi:hypothetical protein